MSKISAELATFLAHSLELEGEAGDRYAELADSLAEHHNSEVAAFFGRMAEEAGRHEAEVRELAGDAPLPQIKAWEFEWPDPEAPESASYEAVHYRMSLREAMMLALDNERAAESYYRGVADTSADEETARVAAGFAAEEAEHAQALVDMLAQLPPDSPYHLEEDDDPHMPE